MKKLFAMFMALAICLSMLPAAFAASPADAVIDIDRLCSIDLYKYDLTSAEADGVWDNSYVSTGTYDKPGVNDILGNPNRVVDLGNGEVSYGYAIRGVEFTYARVADIYQYVGRTQDGTLVAKVLYGFDNMELLSALGLTRENRFAPADHDGKLYFTADTLLTALRSALETNATGTKNALESIVKTSGTAMPETDSYGHSEAKNLPVGLYLVVETRVPEMVTETTAPFLLSLPMTTVDGTQWMYDVCVYPKNGTSNPDLTKTVRESKESTGKNGGTGMIDDGFDHTATASVGDVVEYQILSRLPAITSKASYLTTYTFEDTICKGILYDRNDVVLEFFRDAACTDKIATWNEGDGNFGVGYVTNEDGTSVMTITMQENGLKEINQSTAVHNGIHESGYSQCYLRITYNPFVYLKTDNDVQKLATNLFKNTTPKGSTSQDPFWDQAAMMLLLALMFYLHYEAPEDEQNFPMVMEMIRAGEVKEDDEAFQSPLDILFRKLEMKNPEHIALKYYKAYHSGSGKTLKSIQITLISRLEKFNLTSLAGITQTDELDLAQVGEKKTAIYAVIPDNDASFNFIVGMLYTQLFQQLYYQADVVHGGALPVHVHFVMDEFANETQL